jgi:hypothetical protein
VPTGQVLQVALMGESLYVRSAVQRLQSGYEMVSKSDKSGFTVVGVPTVPKLQAFWIVAPDLM